MMFNRSRFRTLLVFSLVLIALLVTLGSAGAEVPAKTMAKPGGPGRITVAAVEFRGEVIFETGYMFDDTEVGGLSGIVYDPKKGLYLSLSDDRAVINPVRYYTLDIDTRDGYLDPGDIQFVDMTFILDENGAPFGSESLIDPEGIALARSGKLFFSSEGDVIASPPVNPFIRQYNPAGEQTGELSIPAKFLPSGDGTSGVRHNLAFESLNVSPDKRYLYTANEGALAQDGPAANVDQTTLVRILKYNLKSGQPMNEYVYVAEAVAEEPDPPDSFRVSGLVDLLALDKSGTLLAMERSFSVGRGNVVTIFEVQIGDATNVKTFDALIDEATGDPIAFVPVEKRFLVDLGDFVQVVDNVEGMALGPRMVDGLYPLVLVSDNNFSPGQFTQFILLAVDLDLVFD